MARKAIYTMTELNRMDYEAIWAYERKVGFIAPIYSAVTHADNLRQDIADKSVCPEIITRIWHASWIYDNKAQQDYARMIFTARGYFVADASSINQAVYGAPALETYLA